MLSKKILITSQHPPKEISDLCPKNLCITWLEDETSIFEEFPIEQSTTPHSKTYMGDDVETSKEKYVAEKGIPEEFLIQIPILLEGV